MVTVAMLLGWVELSCIGYIHTHKQIDIDIDTDIDRYIARKISRGQIMESFESCSDEFELLSKGYGESWRNYEKWTRWNTICILG